MPNPMIKDQPETSPGKVLVLEDSKAQANMLVEVLAREGYAVTSARDGVEGLYLLMESRPDLIVSDVWMPRLNGYDFCRTVKQDKALANIPVILLTSLSGSEDLAKGLNAGADYYITKPYDKALLLSMVDSVLAGVRRGGNGKGAVEIASKGKTTTITANPQQIANFLFSTHENLLAQNEELEQTRQKLKTANGSLEKMVTEKTLSLEEEIAERRKANEALKRTLNGTVVALARAVEMRDPYTAGHQSRVAELALRIGRELSLPEDRLEGIRVMGMLHDLGKIIVPAEILTKPSTLTDYEFLFIKAHPQAGFDVLKEIEFPWPVAVAVLQHHERLDGSGYPLGALGDQIILEARILAVADVVESMSSHRPYRAALGIEAAVNEVVGKKGVFYAPEVVDGLLRVLESERIQTMMEASARCLSEGTASPKIACRR